MQNNIQNKRKRNFYLVLPILVLPFCALLFWALGGGSAEAQTKASLSGLNVQLPSARQDNDSTANKLSFYQQAEKDAAKAEQAQKDDPYYRDSVQSLPDSFTGLSNSPKDTDQRMGSLGRYETGGLSSSRTSLAENEQRISSQLKMLNQQISRQPEQEVTDDGQQNDLAKVRAVMQSMNGSQDPQMDQIASMLDKIQEIQNPALVQQKLRLESIKHRGQVYAVNNYRTNMPISILDNISSVNNGNGFFSLDDSHTDTTMQNAIQAVVAANQTVTSGSTIKFRLTNDIYINGRMIPKNTFLYGAASLAGERLAVKIASLSYRNSIFPVDLTVYDIDGAEGIYVPGAITRDVAKESADQSLQNIGLTAYDPSLAAQTASAGISAAKTLFSRKVRLVKVTLKAGYQVLLQDEKQKQTQ
jgi:conjugative transposon TraM protein